MNTYQIYRKYKGSWLYVQRRSGPTKAAALREFRADWPEYRRTKLQARQEARNPMKKRKPRTTKRAKSLMASGSKKLAAWVRSQTNRKRRSKKNPVRVAASMSGKSTGWMSAKAVKVVKVGKGKNQTVRVDIER